MLRIIENLTITATALPTTFGKKLALFLADLPPQYDHGRLSLIIKESDLNKFDFQSFYHVLLEKRPQLVFRHFGMQCDYRTVNHRDCLEVIQFIMERSKSAELDGYMYDCLAHPNLRKRKYGCLSGVSKAGNTWFTLQ